MVIKKSIGQISIQLEVNGDEIPLNTGLNTDEILKLNEISALHPATQEKTFIRASFALERSPVRPGAHAPEFQAKRNLPRHRLIHMQEHLGERE